MAEFAINGDPESCAETKANGRWKLDLGRKRMISSVQIKGNPFLMFNSLSQSGA